ncbi:MAG: IS110 family transposase [Hyphomonadaceae bacterium]
METRTWFAGVDWAKQTHHVRLTDDAGKDIGERVFKHGGEGLADMAKWLIEKTQANAEDIRIAIEVPHGPVVETLMERGFSVNAINPKQLDRFRDRFSVSGAKDDSRDARALASALRTDPQCFRHITPVDPTLVELREWSRIADELIGERNRHIARIREQLWRYFPAYLDLEEDVGTGWVLDLWELVPTPQKARRVRKSSVAEVLKKNRIRRFDADQVLAILRQTPVTVQDGAVAAATAHIETIVARTRVVNQQLAQAHQKLDQLTMQLVGASEAHEQHDAAILRSLPGIGRIVLATLLSEAWEPLRRRDYHALRNLCGVAPVTKRSGKTNIVMRRRACHPRLANAVYYWARIAVQRDRICRAKYLALRERGHGFARALRSVADRQLKVACAMLRDGTLFDRALAPEPLPID